MNSSLLIQSSRGACRGDLVRVMGYVEDRHGIEVRDFQMTLLFKSPLTTNESLPTDELLPPEEPENTINQVLGTTFSDSEGDIG